VSKLNSGQFCDNQTTPIHACRTLHRSMAAIQLPERCNVLQHRSNSVRSIPDSTNDSCTVKPLLNKCQYFWESSRIRLSPSLDVSGTSVLHAGCPFCHSTKSYNNNL